KEILKLMIATFLKRQTDITKKIEVDFSNPLIGLTGLNKNDAREQGDYGKAKGIEITNYDKQVSAPTRRNPEGVKVSALKVIYNAPAKKDFTNNPGKSFPDVEEALIKSRNAPFNGLIFRELVEIVRENKQDEEADNITKIIKECEDEVEKQDPELFKHIDKLAKEYLIGAEQRWNEILNKCLEYNKKEDNPHEKISEGEEPAIKKLLSSIKQALENENLKQSCESLKSTLDELKNNSDSPELSILNSLRSETVYLNSYLDD
ncbi:7787_t:CDS:2, partial [Scutellospora calospora]